MVKKRARLTDDNDPLSNTDQVIAGYEQVSQSTSQQVDQSKEPQAQHQPDSKPEKQSEQELETIRLRKATYQISEAVLEELDKFHLKLQLDVGKMNAPYKEVIVEEAISLLLKQLHEDRDLVIDALQNRQLARYSLMEKS